jgi:peroxiredoxin (alkyl hydroperoxide reductase subunit C)
VGYTPDARPGVPLRPARGAGGATGGGAPPAPGAAKEAAMTVRVGKPAPDVDPAVEAYVRGEAQPRRVTVAGFHGRWLVLFFYPRDFSRVCPTELQAFAVLHPLFVREQAAVVGVSTDSYEAHKAWLESDPRLRDVAYPLVADGAHRLSAAYDVLLEDGSTLRGTFLIDPVGILRAVYVNDPDVGRNVQETLRLLRALRTGELCPEGWAPGQATLPARPGAARPDPTRTGWLPGVPGS